MAKEYRIGLGVVHRLVKKTRKNQNFLQELITERDNRQAHKDEIKAAISKMNEEGQILDSVDGIKRSLLTEHKIEAKPHVVREFLRSDMDMRYRKIHPVSVHANSIKNLVMRQQFAL